MKIQRNVILSNEEIQKLLTKFVEKKTSAKVTNCSINGTEGNWQFMLEEQEVTDEPKV